MKLKDSQFVTLSWRGLVSIHYFIAVIAVILLTSCSDWSDKPDVESWARRSSIVLLCDVDSSGEFVRFVVKETVKTNATAGSQFIAGQILPTLGPKIEVGKKYGSEALVFFSPSRDKSGPSAFATLVLHDHVNREEIMTLVRKKQEK